MQNVLDIDAEAHRVGTEDQRSKHPVAVMWDFAAAFPSLIHLWIMMVIAKMRLPPGLQNLIKRLYDGNKVLRMVNGQWLFAYWILCGILQGCPRSGTLFVFSLDPFLREMHSSKLAASMLLRACADDVGGAFVDFRALVPLVGSLRVFH